MLKKIALCFGVILLASTLAPAQTAFTDTAGASLLGVVEGAMNFCSKVSSGSASGYKQIDQIFLQGQSEKTIEQVRESGAYTSSFNQTKKLLQGLSSTDASAVCNAH
jgi:hypothetical protein